MRLRITRTCRAAGDLVVTGAGTTDAGTTDTDRPLARAWLADTACTRLVGLLGTPDLGDDEALVLAPCASVHGVGLRVAIGAAFINARGVVLAVVDPLPRRGAWVRGARAVVEARSGVLRGVRPGDVLRLTGCTVFPHGGTFDARPGGSTGAGSALTGHEGHPSPRDDRSM